MRRTHLGIAALFLFILGFCGKVMTLRVAKSSSLSLVSVTHPNELCLCKPRDFRIAEGVVVKCWLIGRVKEDADLWRLNVILDANWTWALRERIGTGSLDNSNIGELLQSAFSTSAERDLREVKVVRFELDEGPSWPQTNELTRQ